MFKKRFFTYFCVLILAPTIVEANVRQSDVESYSNSISGGFNGSLFIVDSSFTEISDNIEHKLGINKEQDYSQHNHYAIHSNDNIGYAYTQKVYDDTKSNLSFSQVAEQY